MQQQQESTDSNDPLANLQTVLDKVRGFAFEPTLVKQADDLVKGSQNEGQTVRKYRAISLALEIYNEYGYSDRSKTTIRQIQPEIEDILSDISPASFADRSKNEIEEDKSKWEQICWVYAGAAITHYWNNESQHGLACVKKATDVIETYLRPPHNGASRDCSGIRARLSYYEALLYLQLNDPINAEKAMKNSLKLAKKRLSRLEDLYKDQKDYWGTPEGLRESRYTIICVAKIQGFVKARIQLLRGQLSESEFLLQSAEAVLRQSQSPTMVQMIRLWLNKVKRALAGRDIKQLNLIIPELEECYNVFSGKDENAEPAQQNLIYASVAAFEVSLANTYKAQGIRHKIESNVDEELAEAEKKSTEAEKKLSDSDKKKLSDELKRKRLAESREYQDALSAARSFLGAVGKNPSQDKGKVWPASQGLNDYWAFSKALLESRIDRETDPENARENAKLARSIAKGMDNRPDLVADAYIALGEALLKLGKPAEALNKFMEAERENKKDEDKELAKIKAVCCLRKAEAYVALNREYDAQRMLDEWKPLENQVEPEVIHFIARKVEGQLKGLIGDFIISKDGDLNLSIHSKNLERWLTVLAIKRNKDTDKGKPDPKWLVKEMKVSLSKAYKLLKEREPNGKSSKSSSSSTSVSDDSPTDEIDD